MLVFIFVGKVGFDRATFAFYILYGYCLNFMQQFSRGFKYLFFASGIVNNG